MTTDLNNDWLSDHTRTGRPPKLADAELLTLAVAQVLLGVRSEARWLRFVPRALPAAFRYLPGQSGYNKRLRPRCALGRAGHSRHRGRHRRPAHREARALGMDVAGFLMMSHMAPAADLATQARTMEDVGAHCVYVTDSGGRLTMGDVRDRVRAYRDVFDPAPRSGSTPTRTCRCPWPTR